FFTGRSGDDVRLLVGNNRRAYKSPPLYFLPFRSLFFSLYVCMHACMDDCRANILRMNAKWTIRHNDYVTVIILLVWASFVVSCVTISVDVNRVLILMTEKGRPHSTTPFIAEALP
ncbi:hypothetical protein TcCL_ESM01487, partial [Trypanosoma cruzi]